MCTVLCLSRRSLYSCLFTTSDLSQGSLVGLLDGDPSSLRRTQHFLSKRRRQTLLDYFARIYHCTKQSNQGSKKRPREGRAARVAPRLVATEGLQLRFSSSGFDVSSPASAFTSSYNLCLNRSTHTRGAPSFVPPLLLWRLPLLLLSLKWRGFQMRECRRRRFSLTIKMVGEDRTRYSSGFCYSHKQVTFGLSRPARCSSPHRFWARIGFDAVYSISQ